MGEDGERLVLGDLVPIHQDAFCLFDEGARHHCGAEVREIFAGPGCCFRIADCDRDPGRNLLGQLKITVVDYVGASDVGVEGADRRALER